MNIPLRSAQPKYRIPVEVCPPPFQVAVEPALGPWRWPTTEGPWMHFLRSEVPHGPPPVRVPKEGHWLGFNGSPQLAESELDTYRRGETILRKAREGSGTAIHRRFAALFPRPDQDLVAFAAECGPLCAGWIKRESIREHVVRTGNAFVLDTDTITDLYEPLSCWRAESANVKALLCLWDLSSVPAGQDPSWIPPSSNQTLENIVAQRCGEYNAATDHLSQHGAADHHHATASLNGLFRPGRGRRSYEACADLYKDGGPQMLTRRWLAGELQESIRNLGTHLDLELSWKREAVPLLLRVAARSLLGSIYAALLAETLGENSAHVSCSICGDPIPGRLRAGQVNYCSPRCKSRARRKRLKHRGQATSRPK